MTVLYLNQVIDASFLADKGAAKLTKVLVDAVNIKGTHTIIIAKEAQIR